LRAPGDAHDQVLMEVASRWRAARSETLAVRALCGVPTTPSQENSWEMSSESSAKKCSIEPGRSCPRGNCTNMA
jgi:hypothetical protein